MLKTIKNASKVDSKAAMIIANKFIISNFKSCLAAGLPKTVSFPIRNVWIIPVLLSCPNVGIIGEVGMVAVDSESGSVVGFTPKNEMERIGKVLYEEKKDEIEIAFS